MAITDVLAAKTATPNSATSFYPAGPIEVGGSSVDEFDVQGDGINYTQDIGTSPGLFGQALASRVGPLFGRHAVAAATRVKDWLNVVRAGEKFSGD